MLAGLLDRLLRGTIRSGRLKVAFPDGTARVYGDGSGAPVAIRIRDWATVRRVIVSPSLGFGECYTDGSIELVEGTLYALVDLLVASGARRAGLGRIVAWRQAARRLLAPVVQRNPRGRARRSIERHYDADRRLYELLLDADQQYSCAYFETGDETLEEAQAKKKAHIARKLLLDRPGLEVLDIGSGWGGMALHLARAHGCRVLGITLSSEQLETSRARADAAGLSDRVRFELADYRNLDRAPARFFDRIVSVGMFEHVGIGNYARFFEIVRNCLRPDGVAVLHAIGRADGPGSTNEWLDRHIFPGGYSPALSETLRAVEASGLWVTDCEVLRLHYAMTIACWRERFEAARPRIVSFAGAPFCRMFELYLAGAEVAFRRLGHMNFQLQLARARDVVPLTRDYLAARPGPARPALALDERAGDLASP